MPKATARAPRRVLDKPTDKTTVNSMHRPTHHARHSTTEQRRLRAMDRPTRRAAASVTQGIRRPRQASQPLIVPPSLLPPPPQARKVWMRSWLTAPAQQTPVHSDRPAAVADSVGRMVMA